MQLWIVVIEFWLDSVSDSQYGIFGVSANTKELAIEQAKEVFFTHYGATEHHSAEERIFSANAMPAQAGELYWSNN